MTSKRNRDAPKPVDGIPVGDNHRRGITATLASLDKMTCHAEKLAQGDTVQSVLYEERNSLSDAQKRELLAEVGALRQLLDEMRRTLLLEPTVQDGAASLSASCVGLWEWVLELQGKYLNRYGPPSEELVQYLDPKTEEIIAHLDRIVHVLGVFHLSGPASQTPT